MIDTVAELKAEIERLNERLRAMGREKANLQMAVDMINQAAQVVGLVDVVDRILQILVGAIGGSNIAIYYKSAGQWHYADVLGSKRKLNEVDDELVQRALDQKTFLKRSKTGESKLTMSGYSKSEEIWIYPLHVHNEFFGAIRLEGMALQYAHYRANIDSFIQYAALVLFHEVSNVRRLEAAYQKVIRAKEALHESEEQHRSAIQAAMDGFWLLDGKGRLLEVNKAYCRMSGYSETELLSMSIPELEAIETVHETRARIQRVISEGESLFETQHRRKNGTVFDVEISVQYRSNDGGRFFCFLRDITDRKKIETQLRQAQKMEAIGNLAGGIAHDFNNVLFPIIGLSELLLEDLTPESLEHENIQMIFKAAERGRNLVQQILAFSRQYEHKMMPLRIQNLIKEVLKLSRSTIPANIEISRHIQSNCPLIMGDITQIHQVVMNLITNAYHAVEETGGGISLHLKETTFGPENLPVASIEPGSYAVLSVSDTGCGIDPEHIEKIFEPYFTTKKQGKGTGLGLATAYGIVREHGGDISVYSEVGKGSTFKIYLPLMEKSFETESIGELKAYQAGTERILLVDDEEAIARLEGVMLERIGYRVKTFTGSLDALAAFRAHPHDFDLVITDMAMPKMTGSQLAGALLSIRRDIPIIICTGFSELLNEQKAESLGIHGFLKKPISKSEMARTVREVLDASHP
jgi:PAS domain S-box-containing protein